MRVIDESFKISFKMVDRRYTPFELSNAFFRDEHGKSLGSGGKLFAEITHGVSVRIVNGEKRGGPRYLYGPFKKHVTGYPYP